MTHRCSRLRKGFTLIELMVTLALLGVLMVVAIPSFVAFQRSAELTSTTNSLVGILSSARGEAMKRSAPTMVMPADGTNWAGGWIAFVDTNYDSAYNEGTDTVITRRAEALPAYLTMTKTGTTGTGGTAYFVRYNGSGYSVSSSGFADLTFEVQNTLASSSELLAQTRRIKVNTSGRPRVCTPKSGDTTCESTGG